MSGVSTSNALHKCMNRCIMTLKISVLTDSNSKEESMPSNNVVETLRALFLCMELPGYFANCIQLLSDATKGSITVIFWPNTDSAPFENSIPGVKLINRRTLNRLQLES